MKGNLMFLVEREVGRALSERHEGYQPFLKGRRLFKREARHSVVTVYLLI